MPNSSMMNKTVNYKLEQAQSTSNKLNLLFKNKANMTPMAYYMR